MAPRATAVSVLVRFIVISLKRDWMSHALYETPQVCESLPRKCKRRKRLLPDEPVGKMHKHVVILGCGFGGLFAAQQLAGAPVRVTVVDRANHHLFQPLLYQVATAGLSAPAIAAPIRQILEHQRNATVLMADVKRVDVEKRAVVFDDDSALAYDFLIVATGSTHSYFGHSEW